MSKNKTFDEYIFGLFVFSRYIKQANWRNVTQKKENKPSACLYQRIERLLSLYFAGPEDV